MSRLLGLQNGIIYGPVDSRRLGSSLGINLLPTGYKACPFNCAYCQYGFTPAKGYKSTWNGEDMPSVEDVVRALEDGLDEYPAVSYVTFSGNGEPTLHPQFGAIVDEVRKVKERLAPRARLAILSNSALVTRAEILEALGRLDVCFMKLDAGDEKNFINFNRPHRDIKYSEVLEGLKKMKDITIQALFTGGEHGNGDKRHIEKWAQKIDEIRPKEVHIYSLDRGTPDGKLNRIDKDGLLNIKATAAMYSDVPVHVY